MDALMAANLWPDMNTPILELSEPGACSTLNDKSPEMEPGEWREMVMATAKACKWPKPRKKDLQTARGFVQYLKKVGMLGELEDVTDRYHGLIALPAGAAVVGNADGKALLAFWLEERVHEHCLHCRIYQQGKCEGKCAALLKYPTNPAEPYCLPECHGEFPFTSEERIAHDCQFCCTKQREKCNGKTVAERYAEGRKELECRELCDPEKGCPHYPDACQFGFPYPTDEELEYFINNPIDLEITQEEEV